MNTQGHTPACAESPHFCICSTTRPGSITPEGEKPKLMEPLSHPGLVTMDNITVDPDTANLFKEPGTLVAAGGWSVPKDPDLWKEELPEVSVARGGIKYPTPNGPIPYKVWQSDLRARDAKLNTAQEQSRFWRRSFIVLAGMAAASNVVTVTGWMGWW